VTKCEEKGSGKQSHRRDVTSREKVHFYDEGPQAKKKKRQPCSGGIGHPFHSGQIPSIPWRTIPDTSQKPPPHPGVPGKKKTGGRDNVRRRLSSISTAHQQGGLRELPPLSLQAPPLQTAKPRVCHVARVPIDCWPGARTHRSVEETLFEQLDVRRQWRRGAEKPSRRSLG